MNGHRHDGLPMLPHSYINNIGEEDQFEKSDRTAEVEPNYNKTFVANSEAYTNYFHLNPIGYYYPELIQDGKLQTRTDDQVYATVIELSLKVALILVLFVYPYYYNYSNGLFCVSILLTSVDFWVSKNFSGRKMINLRWWIEFEQEQGRWVLEKRHQIYPTDRALVYCFWYVKFACIGGLLAAEAYWILREKFVLAITINYPIVSMLINVWMFNHCLQSQSTQIALYLEGVVNQRLRRSIKLEFDPFSRTAIKFRNF